MTRRTPRLSSSWTEVHLCNCPLCVFVLEGVDRQVVQGNAMADAAAFLMCLCIPRGSATERWMYDWGRQPAIITDPPKCMPHCADFLCCTPTLFVTNLPKVGGYYRESSWKLSLHVPGACTPAPPSFRAIVQKMRLRHHAAAPHVQELQVPIQFRFRFGSDSV